MGVNKGFVITSLVALAALLGLGAMVLLGSVDVWPFLLVAALVLFFGVVEVAVVRHGGPRPGTVPAPAEGPGTDQRPGTRSWLKEHPVVFAVLVAFIMFAAGNRSFGDLRAAAGAAIYGFLFIYSGYRRPGGWVWRLERHELRELERRDEVGVRPVWLLKAGGIVVGWLAAFLFVTWIADSIL